MTSEPDRHHAAPEWTLDELNQRSGVPVRTIREYQTVGLLHPPRRVGRVGYYETSHLRRLQLVARLQDRGDSLAGIRDLLGAWRDGAALTDVLGLDAALAVLDAVARLPARPDAGRVDALVGRGRGRLTLHRIGRTVGVTGDDSPADINRRSAAARTPTATRQP